MAKYKVSLMIPATRTLTLEVSAKTEIEARSLVMRDAGGSSKVKLLKEIVDSSEKDLEDRVVVDIVKQD